MMHCKHMGMIEKDLTKTEKISLNIKHCLVVALKKKANHDFTPFFSDFISII